MGDLPPTSGSESYETNSAEGDAPRFRPRSQRPWRPGHIHQLLMQSDMERDAHRHLAARRRLRQRREEQDQYETMQEFDWMNQPAREDVAEMARGTVGNLLPGDLTERTFNSLGGSIPIDPVTRQWNQPGMASYRVVNAAAAVPPEWREMTFNGRTRRVARRVEQPRERLIELPAYPEVVDTRRQRTMLRQTLARAEQHLRNRANNRIYTPINVDLDTTTQRAFEHMTGADSDPEFDTDLSSTGNRFGN